MRVSRYFHHLSSSQSKMASLPAIAFPENVEVVKISRMHPILKHISLLSRRTISSVVIIYLIAKLLIEPKIELSFKYRFELQNHVYRKLKELSKKLETKVKNIPHAVTYNGRKLIDRSTMTDDLISNNREVSFGSSRGKSKPTFEFLNQNGNQAMDKLIDKLNKLKLSLQTLSIPEYNKWDGSVSFGGNHEMDSLLLQMKQFKSYLEIVTSEHPRDMLFRRPVSHIEVDSSTHNYNNHQHNYLDILHSDLNEIKRKISIN